MPAIFWLQCLALASSSRAWPAPTMLNLMAVTLHHGNNKIDILNTLPLFYFI